MKLSDNYQVAFKKAFGNYHTMGVLVQRSKNDFHLF